MTNMTIGICIFGFNRLDSISEVFSNLASQTFNADFHIHLFIDGPKSSVDSEIQKEIVSLATRLFEARKLFVHSRTVNVGLRENIIEGINVIRQDYPAFLVLEDDTVLAPGALCYVSKMLFKHYRSSSIMHINLWNFFGVTNRGPYYTEHMHCWGWASWSDRWPSDIREVLNWKLSFSEKIKVSKFFSTSHYSHFYGNKVGSNKTWAILWMVYIIRCRGLIVAPPVSLVKNIGLTSGSNVETVVQRQQELSLIDSEKYANLEISLSRSTDFLCWIRGIKNTSKLSLLKNLYLMVFK